MWEGKSRSSRSQWSQSAVSCVSGRSHGDFRRPDVILTRRNRRAPPRGAAPVGTAPFPPSSALIGRVKSRGRGLDEKGVARARALRLSLGDPGFVLFSARRGESGGGEVSGNRTEPGRGPRLRNRPGERSQERGAGSGERCGPRPVDGPRNGARGPEPGRGAARPGGGPWDRSSAGVVGPESRPEGRSQAQRPEPGRVHRGLEPEERNRAGEGGPGTGTGAEVDRIRRSSVPHPGVGSPRPGRGENRIPVPDRGERGGF